MYEELEYLLRDFENVEVLSLGEFGVFIGPRDSVRKVEEMDEEELFHCES